MGSVKKMVDPTSFLKQRVLESVSIVVAIILWQCTSDLIVRNKFILPSFSDFAIAFLKLVSIGTMPMDIMTSLLHLGIGLAAATCVGISIGALTGWFKTANRIADPVIEILRPIPPLAWIPFAIIWLHLTHYAAGFVVFMGAVFPILISTQSGFRNVPKVLVESAKVLGCTKDYDLIKAVAFPSSLPLITTGIRIGTGVGWMSVIAAEMFGVSTSGLGYRIFQRFYFLHQMDNLVVYMVLLGLIALFFDRFFRSFVEGRLLKWHKAIAA